MKVGTTRATDRAPSGRFVIRMEPSLHEAMRESAAAAGLSLNQYCVRALAGRVGAPVAGPRVVARAREIVGPDLVGVALFGSWARDTARDDSDVDLLIVLGGDSSITRALYREWDAEPLAWEGLPVEPHFVRLPDPSDPVSGLWAEVAIDGVVLFERGSGLSKWLAAIRHRIAAGELIRRMSNGQPYWVRGARGMDAES